MAERKIEGSIQSIDSSGNLVTSIPVDALVKVPRGEETAVLCDEHETRGIFDDDKSQPPMTLIALLGRQRKARAGHRGRQRRYHAGGDRRHPGVRDW